MNILIYLAPIFLLLSCIALTWLTVRAFKWHTGWGFAVMLLSPISATAFGVSHWRNEKLPFIAYITTFAASIALSLYMFTTWGGWDMLRMTRQAIQGGEVQFASRQDVLGFIKANLSSADDSSRYRAQSGPELLPVVEPEFQVNEPDETEATVEEESGYVGLNRKITPKTERYRLVYAPIKVSDAKNYIGATMKVTRKNVGEKEYRLVSATPSSMEFSQRNKHGSFSLNFKTREIEKIRVLIKEPY